MYHENSKGCINSIQENIINCYTKGLNSVGCYLCNDNCYYDKIKCIKALDIDIIIEGPIIDNAP